MTAASWAAFTLWLWVFTGVPVGGSDQVWTFLPSCRWTGMHKHSRAAGSGFSSALRLWWPVQSLSAVSVLFSAPESGTKPSVTPALRPQGGGGLISASDAVPWFISRPKCCSSGVLSPLAMEGFSLCVWWVLDFQPSDSAAVALQS